jgi:hypothetical protein
MAHHQVLTTLQNQQAWNQKTTTKPIAVCTLSAQKITMTAAENVAETTTTDAEKQLPHPRQNRSNIDHSSPSYRRM